MAAPTLFGSAVRASVAAGTSLTGTQIFTTVTGLPNGHFAMAWNVENGHELVFLGSNGSEVGSSSADFGIPNGTQAANSSAQIRLAALSDGRVVVAWSHNTITPGDAGEVLWGYFTEADGSSSWNTIWRSGYQGEVAVAATVNNRFILAGVYDGTLRDAGRIAGFTALGDISSGSVYIGASPAGVQSHVSVVALASGKSVMATTDLATNRISASLLQPNGFWSSDKFLTDATEVPTDSGDPQTGTVSMAALVNGGFMIAYQAGGELKFKTFDGAMNATSALQSTSGATALYAPSLVSLPDGRAIIFYGTAVNDIKGQVISATGALDGAAFDVASTAANEFMPQASLLADGRIVVSYSATGVPGGNGADAMYQIVDPRENGLYGVSASAGWDEWYGTSAADFVLMGAGDDIFHADAGVDFIYGEAGDDTLFGGAGGDTLIGGNENDTLNGEADNDALFGDNGNDTLNGDGGDDFLYGGAGADALNGGNGFDYASYLLASSAVTADLAGINAGIGDALGDAFTSVEGLIGSNFSDSLFGDATDNWIYGNDGNDLIFGRGGNDVLIGGIGDDALDGGAGADALFGEAGTNSASYVSATAAVIADLANVALNTGDAAGDTYSNIQGLAGSGFADVLRGDGNANVLVGNDGADSLFGRGGADSLSGGNGNDMLEGGAGGDTLLGGAGFDYAGYAYAAAGVTADLQIAANNLGDALGDTYTTIEGLIGSAFADSLRGDAQDNWIYGGDGADFIYGRDGADTLLGDGGNDVLYGGAGNDAIYGGAGNDTLVMAVGDGKDVFYDFVGGAGASDSVLISTALGVSSYAQLQTKMTQVGGNVVITFDVNTAITLVATTLAALSADDFGFY